MTEASNNPAVVPEVRTLLATDFVSSTKLVEQIGDEAAALIFAHHDRLIRDMAIKHNGLEIDKTDGFLFLFTRPRDATVFALAYHDALRALSEEKTQQLSARIGIHLGEVVLRRNSPEDVQRGAKPIEVEGLAKHMVARVMSLATSHQTLLTGPPFQLARRAHQGQSPYPEDVAWVKHGHYALKGIDEAILVYEVGRRSLAPLTAPSNTEKARRVRAREASTYDGEVRPARKHRTILLPAIVFILLGLGLFVVLRGETGITKIPAKNFKQKLKSATKPKKAPALRTNSKTPKFTLHLVSRPAGALFEVVDGAVLGTAPTSLELKARATQFTLRASLDGHHPATVICVITDADVKRRSGICTAELAKLKSKTPARPSKKKTEGLGDYKDNPFGDE